MKIELPKDVIVHPSKNKVHICCDEWDELIKQFTIINQSLDQGILVRSHGLGSHVWDSSCPDDEHWDFQGLLINIESIEKKSREERLEALVKSILDKTHNVGNKTWLATSDHDEALDLLAGI